jgi:glucose-6-phosphate isomerase
MRLSFFDSSAVTSASLAKETKKLSTYRTHVHTVCTTRDSSQSEYSLVHATSPELHDTITALTKKFSKIKHLVLVGIGGSSLGVEAVHGVLTTGKVSLTVLDTISAHDIDVVKATLAGIKKADQVAVCVVSKSGGTAETLVNASVLLDILKTQLGSSIYTQTIFIGDPGTDFMKAGKKLGVTTVAMPKVVGGRYSVATEVGLIPLALLGHDVDAYIEGIADSHIDDYEHMTAESAARMSLYIQKNFRHYNFFAFEKRLETLGAWYRQLFAESIGKATDRAGKPFKKGFLPTISTPVELHSIGQLYLSGYDGVYTDFVTFDDEESDYQIPKHGIAKAYGRFSAQEVTTALYGGVVSAYNEKQLPYRATIFDENLAYSLGLFMAMRMRETMYIAELLNLNAFDQPNVELYKQKTKAILGL